MSVPVTAAPFVNFTPDSQYPASAEAVYAEWCELRLWSTRNDDWTLTRNRRAELVAEYDAITRFSIVERGTRDTILQDAMKAADAARVLEYQRHEAMEGRR